MDVSGFGERLKRERESRDTPLEDVARRTRIGIQYLEALERGDFDGLPGRRGFGKFYIRLYAELFGFDPEPVISEYDRERLEHELPVDTGSLVRPKRPRRVRFVPRARRSPSTERTTRTPSPPAEESVPDPATLPTQPTGPTAPSMAPRDADAAAPASAALSGPDPVPDVGPAEPGVPSFTPAEASMAEEPPSWTRRIVGGAAALVVLGAFGVTLQMRASRAVDPPVQEPPAEAGAATPSPESRSPGEDTRVGQDAAGRPDARAPLAAARVEPAAPVSHEPPAASTAAAAAAPRPADSRHLEVDAFELGTGVVDHRPVDVRRDFEEGAVASFLTRVRGGAPGQTIYHAWIREGRLVQRIGLRLGSPDWRTHSTKTLWGSGDWAVEARDETDRTLARIEFRCLPASVPESGP